MIETMTRTVKTTLVVFLFLVANTIAQTSSPSPTPKDQRGIGVQSSTSSAGGPAGQLAKEAKPELVLQTGYSDLFGPTRVVFSPDGRLLATTSFHNGSIKLWEIATTRKLREFTTGTNGGNTLAPAMAFSRDGRFIAAAAGDNSIKVWEVATGREVQTLAGPQGTVMASFGVYFLAFTSDNRVVTLSDAIRMWDLSTGHESRVIELSTGSLAGFNGIEGACILNADGSQLTLMADNRSNELRTIDLATGKEVRRIKLPEGQPETLQLTYTADGRLIASAIIDKRLKLWNLTSRTSKDLGTTAKDYSQIKFSRDGRLLLLSENYSVRMWETTTAVELTPIKVPNSGAFAQADAFATFSEDGRRVATSGFDTDAIIWEIESGKQIAKLTGRTNPAYNVAFSADGTHLFVGGRTRWDLRTGRGLRVTTTALNKTYPVQSPDSGLLAFIRPNSPVLEIIESATGRKLFALAPKGESGIVERVRFSPDSSILAVTYTPKPDQTASTVSTTGGGSLKLWDLKSGNELRTLTSTGAPVAVEFTKDGKEIATIGSLGEIALWDVQSGNKLHELASSTLQSPSNVTRTQQTGRTPPSMPSMDDIAALLTNTLGTMSAGTMGQRVTSLAFTPDGRILATGGLESKSNLDIAALMSGAMNQKRQKNSRQQQDPMAMMKDFKVEAIGQIQLWDVATGQETVAIKGFGRAVTRVAISRDGKLLAASNSDNTIKIWDLASRKELKTLAGHSSSIDSLDFSPDNNVIASAAEDGATFLWDVNSGEHLLTLISIDDGSEWMVVTPQGLFDGTPATWNQILWRYNQETFNVAPIEWFFNEFYYPGLLAEVFAGKQPRVAQDISKRDRRQPLVKLTLAGDVPTTGITTRQVKVRIEVSDAPPDRDNRKGSGARDLRLFRNGSLIKVWHGDVLKGQSNMMLEQDITITAGSNQLVAYAFNDDNVKSKDAPLLLTGAEDLRRKGTAYIIAIGINEYENNEYNLKYAVADAQSFAGEVRDRQINIGEFERVEVVSLLNAEATKANIMDVLKRLSGVVRPPTLKATPLDSLKRVEPEDTVIIYYAGHGTAQATRFYLIPHDLGYKGDRTELDQAGLQAILAHSISDVELENAVESIDAAHLLLIIDACNSGQALEAEEKRRGPMNSKGLAQLAYEKGMYILTAAQSFQAALEAAQLGHGLLTYVLVEEGLKTAVADYEPKDGLLVAREWLDFATERVPQMQTQKMIEGRGIGKDIAFTEGEEKQIREPNRRSVQRPRVFYRREMESNPLVIAKP